MYNQGQYQRLGKARLHCRRPVHNQSALQALYRVPRRQITVRRLCSNSYEIHALNPWHRELPILASILHVCV